MRRGKRKVNRYLPGIVYFAVEEDPVVSVSEVAVSVIIIQTIKDKQRREEKTKKGKEGEERVRERRRGY